MSSVDTGGRGRGGRGFGRGRGRFEGGRRARKPDPQPCPITTDEDGNLKMKATILIMRDNAGAVIGHRGDHVAAVRQETGALVHVCDPNFETGVQGVDVFGRIPQIIAAQAKIAAVLADNAPDWAADAGWGARLNLHVLPDMASIVIGKKGATVQTVQRESGANVRIGKEADANNLQLVQFYGTNDQVTLAFAMVVDNLTHYDPSGSETIEQLRARWEQRRVAESFAPPDVQVDGGGGGNSRGGSYGGRSDSRGGYGGNDRYEPDPRSGGSRSGGRYDYDGRRGSYGGDLRGAGAVPAGVPAAGPVVVMQGGQPYPQGMAGPMPTVLMQQADGSLVQVQVMSHAGGHYAVQPATQLVNGHPHVQQGAVAQMKVDGGISQPYSVHATGAPVGVPGGKGHEAMHMQPQLGQVQMIYQQPPQQDGGLATQYTASVGQPQYAQQAPPQQQYSAVQQQQYSMPSSSSAPVATAYGGAAQHSSAAGQASSQYSQSAAAHQPQPTTYSQHAQPYSASSSHGYGGASSYPASYPGLSK